MTEPAVETGSVLSVGQMVLGDELAADAAIAATTITVVDATDFDAYYGGTVSINDAQYTYVVTDVDNGMLTVTPGLLAAASQGDAVAVWDLVASAVAVEFRAAVDLPGDLDNADSVDCRIARSLVPLLPVGLRDPGTGETVAIERRTGEWVVIDVIGGQPTQQADNVTPSSTVPKHHATHEHGGSDEVSLDAAQVTSGQLAMARLASGTPDGTKFIADDGTLKTPGGGGGGGSTDVQLFTASGTWTKPAGAKFVEVTVIGGGGGGASGGKWSVGGSVAVGGAGGSAGGVSRMTFRAADLTATVAVTVGAKGTGGSPLTTNNTQGLDGTAGGDSAFGAYLAAGGGLAGTGSTAHNNATPTTEAPSIGLSQPGAGGAGSVAGAAGATALFTRAATGGGGGGGVDSTTPDVGAAGGTQAVLGGVTGGTGGAVDNPGGDGGSVGVIGLGGGGGGGSISTTAVGGGNGGNYGGGGGGGGGVVFRNPSGKGGDGGPGCVLVVTYV